MDTRQQTVTAELPAGVDVSGNGAGASPAATPAGQTTTGTRRGHLSLLTDPVQWLALAAVFAADQVSKSLIISSLDIRESWPAEGFFRLTHTFNTGTAFGLFQGSGGILTVVSLVAVVVLYFFYRSASSPSLLMRLAFGMQLGGAFGNLLDRVRLGHVTDFLDVGPWPVFNVADSAIVCGIALMAYHFWTDRDETARKPSSSAQPDQSGVG
jgi:signal peptidase II